MQMMTTTTHVPVDVTAGEGAGGDYQGAGGDYQGAGGDYAAGRRELGAGRGGERTE
jgi:hypothetical protein